MNNVTPMKSDNPLVVLHEQMEKRTSQFQAALPAHIPVERFKRVLLTAIQNNPKLAEADRPTFFNSAMKAAQDGLLPDGREGAMVIYRTKVKINGSEKWVDAVQWIPMIGGLRKKVRNSQEIATWDVKAVYAKDEFLYEEGIDMVLKHKPFMDGPPGELKAVYSIAKLKTGEISIDVMPRWQVDRIRALSKSKDNGPWVDHYDEMAKKTVARRHSKVLPMSTDLDDLIRRDDELYDMDSASDKQVNAGVRRPQLSDFSEVESSLPSDTKSGEPAAPTPSPETTSSAGRGEAEELPSAASPEQSEGPSPADAMQMGREARDKGKALRAVPPEWRDKAEAEPLASAWQAGWRERDEEMLKEGR